MRQNLPLLPPRHHLSYVLAVVLWKSFPSFYHSCVCSHYSSSDVTTPDVPRDPKVSSSAFRLNLLGRPLLNTLAATRTDRLNEKRRRPWTIGVAGPAGAGKSSVAKHLKDFGGDRVRILEADLIGHQAYESVLCCFQHLITIPIVDLELIPTTRL